MFGILFTFFHISNKMTALKRTQKINKNSRRKVKEKKEDLDDGIYHMSEYSMVHGNKNGDASWMSVVIMVDSLQSATLISLCRFVNKRSVSLGTCVVVVVLRLLLPSIGGYDTKGVVFTKSVGNATY